MTMPKELSIEEMVEIVEGFGWDYAESSDGTGDMFVYWDHLNGDMPDWAGDNMTSCECLETIYEMYVNQKKGEL